MMDSGLIKSNLCSNQPAIYSAAACGFCLFVELLPVGEHHVDLEVSVLNPIQTPFYHNNN
jgi:hypothetical protein